MEKRRETQRFCRCCNKWKVIREFSLLRSRNICKACKKKAKKYLSYLRNRDRKRKERQATKNPA